MLRKRLINLTIAFASFGSLAIASPAVLATSNSNAGNKVTICHATGSTTNPFVQISPDANGVISGHVNHQDTRDIIPAFDYNDHGTTKHFPGQNFGAQGQAILNNGCKVGGQGGGTVTPPPTGGGTTPVTPTGGQGGGVTLGTNTTQTEAAAGQGAGVAAVPEGGVNAGSGAVSTVSSVAAAGLVASIASIALGVRRLKSEL